MKIEIEDAIADNAKGLINHLTLESMKANYPDFMRVYDNPERADQGMINIYGKEQWDTHCEYIWQWYDLDYSDE
jgi:hypothetical protein